MTNTDAIETMNITVDAPEAGWSGIRFDKEAFIPLSYVQNIPEDIIDAAETWMAGEDVNLFCDGEGEIWELRMPAGDATVAIDDMDGHVRTTSIPTKVCLLQLIDGMLMNVRGWAIWQSMCDGEEIEYEDRLDAWNVYIAGRTKGLADRLRALRDQLAAA